MAHIFVSQNAMNKQRRFSLAELIPDVVVHQILEFCDPKSLLNASMVCKMWNSVCPWCRFWPITQLSPICTIIDAHTDGVGSLIAINGKIYTGSVWSKDIRVWDRISGNRVGSFRRRGIVYLSRHKQSLLVASIDNTVETWGLETGQQERVLQSRSFFHHLTVIDGSDELVFAGSSDSCICVFDWQNSRRTQILNGHEASISALKTQGNNILWSGSHDRTLRKWVVNEEEFVCREVLHGVISPPPQKNI